MNERLSPGGSFWERGRSERAVLMVVVMAFAAIALNDGVHSFTAPAGDARHKMKHFVLLFRQGPSPLSEADLKARADAIVTWAERQNDAGHNLDPRSLQHLAPRRDHVCGHLTLVVRELVVKA